MCNLKLSLTALLVVTFYGLITCSEDNINKQLTPQQNNEQLNKTLAELLKNVTNSRSGRTLLSHNRMPAFTLRRRQPIQIRARADHFPIRTQIRRVHNSLQNGQKQQPNMRHGFESLKSSKHIPPSKMANLPFPKIGKGSPYRPQLLGAHPNSIHLPGLSQQYIHNFKASPSFNGQVVVHPVSQAQKQQSASTQQDNSYPKYVKPQHHPATAVISPQLQQQQQQQQQHQQKPVLIKYPDFKQYPIPDQEKLQQHNEQHEKYLQQQKFLTPKNPIAYYQMQHSQQPQPQQHQDLPAQPQQNYAVQQPHHNLPQTQLQQQQQQQQQPQQHQPSIPIHESTQANNINNIAFPAAAAVPPKMYSVYEENDMSELQTNNYDGPIYQVLGKEAQEYLQFMNTDEYFLPQKEPNYKNMDNESDKRQYTVLKAQIQQQLHSAAPYQQSQSQQAAYHQSLYAPSSVSQNAQFSNSLYADASEGPAYNQGVPISRLFYQQDPLTTGPASGTVLRTSYHTGYNQNQFVGNPQSNKIAKVTIPPTSTTSSILISTQPPASYPQLRYNSAGDRTPEPLRFEFTERDAMINSLPYTNAPQGQLRYKEITSNSVTPIVPAGKSSTTTLKAQDYDGNKLTIRPIVEQGEDDPEEGDDMFETGNGIFGRQPLAANAKKASSSTTETLPSEQKDTEDYCERMCAIVEDENEEIVCGSDGYMYTSEAQMECYASCLHIDVTIQGKGSCSKR